MRTYPILDHVGAATLTVVFLVLIASEHARPLRRRLQHWIARGAVNLALALPACALLRLLLIPVVVAAATWAGKHDLGLARMVPMPAWLAGAVALLVLDYSMYLWHLANHRWSLFWRFHRVHHSDLDLDVTTAMRFHFGEIGFSVLVRTVQVVVAGASPAVALLYEVLLELSTQFHHSNLRLPLALERPLSWLIMTPRAHGIHHSIEAREMNRNYSNFLMIWDRLHGTLKVDVPQDKIVIGLPDLRDERKLRPWQLFLMPFRGPAPIPPVPAGKPPIGNLTTPDPPGTLAP
jgi:sterol desaturase/sphingolipid hydroxylase (fatty acid hydroxylase superfamily)